METPPPAPGQFFVQAHELPLSSQALVELMRAVLARGMPFRFSAHGWSMTPFIRDGDVITIVGLAGAAPGLGEVVAYARPQAGGLVVHRVVARRGETILVRGDNGLDAVEEEVLPTCLLGRVSRVERYGRSVWLGLGPERVLIAWLSRALLLSPLLNRAAAWRKSILRR